MTRSATGQYRVLAWAASSVSVGTLHRDQLVLDPLPDQPGLRDIRSCNPAPDGSWVLVSGVDATSGVHALWRLDVSGARPTRLLQDDYLLHPAAAPSGSLIAYTAPPFRTPADTSLHLLDTDQAATRLLVEGTVARDCVPSWRGGGHVLFHTEGGDVCEVALDTGDVRRLFRGEHPAVSPDDTRIAHRDGSAVLVADAAGAITDISPRRGLLRRPYRGSMSWSPDGRLLLLARSGGTLGYELDFGTLDVATRTFTRIRTRHLGGIAFR
jgi:Tol biopolymer transport system component